MTRLAARHFQVFSVTASYEHPRFFLPVRPILAEVSSIARTEGVKRDNNLTACLFEVKHPSKRPLDGDVANSRRTASQWCFTGGSRGQRIKARCVTDKATMYVEVSFTVDLIDLIT